MSDIDVTNLEEPPAPAMPPAPQPGGFIAPGPTFSDWVGQAEYLAATPPGQGMPGELIGNPHAIVMRMQFAQALDIPLFVAIQDLFVIDNRVGMAAALIRGLMLRAGHEFSFPHADEKMCVMRLRRKERPDQELEVIWTVEEAEQAGLLSNPKTADYWQAYPADCNLAACTRRMGRRHASDLTRGFGYGRDELALASATAPFAVNAEELAAQVAEVVDDARRATDLKRLKAVAQDAEKRSLVNQVTDEQGPAAGETVRWYLLQRWNKVAAATGQPLHLGRPVADTPEPGQAPEDPYAGEPQAWVHRECGNCKAMSVLVNGDHDPGCELRKTPTGKKEQQ